jgi:hypothetical protein
VQDTGSSTKNARPIAAQGILPPRQPAVVITQPSRRCGSINLILRGLRLFSLPKGKIPGPLSSLAGHMMSVYLRGSSLGFRYSMPQGPLP